MSQRLTYVECFGTATAFDGWTACAQTDKDEVVPCSTTILEELVVHSPRQNSCKETIDGRTPWHARLGEV